MPEHRLAIFFLVRRILEYGSKNHRGLLTWPTTEKTGLAFVVVFFFFFFFFFLGGGGSKFIISIFLGVFRKMNIFGV